MSEAGRQHGDEREKRDQRGRHPRDINHCGAEGSLRLRNSLHPMGGRAEGGVPSTRWSNGEVSAASRWVAVPLLLLVVGTLVRSQRMPDASVSATIAAWLVFAVAMRFSPSGNGGSTPERAVLQMGIAALAGAALVGVTSGPVLAVWWLAAAAATGLSLSAPNAPRWSFVIGLSILAALSVANALDPGSGRWGLVPAGGAAMLALVNFRWAESLDAATGWVADRVGAVLGVATFGLLGTATLAVPRSNLARSGWATPSAVTPKRWAWFPVLLTLAVGAGLLAWVSGSWPFQSAAPVVTSSAGDMFELDGVARRNEGRGGSWWEETTGDPPAYVGASWYPEYRDDIMWVMNQGVAFRPLSSLRVADVSTRWVNVVDGQRRTWSPPECGCRRFRVWVYGGSTTFGLGQRDEFTIPSQIAKLAWEQGVAIDVENRGQPGDLHWQEADRFAWDVAGETAPDLVIFYDGVNEIWGTATGADFGQPDPAQPIAPMTEVFWQELLRAYDSQPPAAPPGAELSPTTTAPPLSPAEIGSLAVRRYERSLEPSRDIAAANEIPALWLWQPSRLSRPPVDGEPSNSTGEDRVRQIAAAAEAGIPDGVVDLTGALDDLDGPLFTDDVHHNEKAANAVAERILALALPKLGLDSPSGPPAG